MTDESPKTRLERLLASPDTLDIVFDHVASGGSIIELVKTWDVNYGKFSRWLYDDPERFKRYALALELREQWAREHIDNQLHTISQDNADDGENSRLKYSSKLKALDMLGKRHGVFIDKTEHSGTIKLDELIGGSFPKKPEGK